MLGTAEHFIFILILPVYAVCKNLHDFVQNLDASSCTLVYINNYGQFHKLVIKTFMSKTQTNSLARGHCMSHISIAIVLYIIPH